eukprot:jgi/Mesen1/10442/ME000082S09950
MGKDTCHAWPIFSSELKKNHLERMHLTPVHFKVELMDSVWAVPSDRCASRAVTLYCYAFNLGNHTGSVMLSWQQQPPRIDCQLSQRNCWQWERRLTTVTDNSNQDKDEGEEERQRRSRSGWKKKKKKDTVANNDNDDCEEKDEAIWASALTGGPQDQSWTDRWPPAGRGGTSSDTWRCHPCPVTAGGPFPHQHLRCWDDGGDDGLTLPSIEPGPAPRYARALSRSLARCLPALSRCATLLALSCMLSLLSFRLRRNIV